MRSSFSPSGSTSRRGVTSRSRRRLAAWWSPFEILDGTHKKVIDGAWGISDWWYGKSVDRDAVCEDAAGDFGMDAVDSRLDRPGWRP